MITCIDLFCGLGGLTHGLIRNGVRVRAGIDIDEQCRYPYEENNDAQFIQENVSNLDGNTLRNLWGDCGYTLLAGCAPCQPFSSYSRKARKTPETSQDSRWALVADFGRLIEEATPDFVTMENVPQLVAHRVFKEFLCSLKAYHVWYDVIECARYGVPQTRKRLVLLASRLGPISLIAPTRSANGGRATVRAAIAHLPPLAAGCSDPHDKLHSACKLNPLNLQRIKASVPGGTWRDWPPELVSHCHRKASGDTYPSVYGRMEWDAPAPTITTQCFGYGNGRFGHPQQDRAITLREAALLQTFPQSYRFLRCNERVCFYILGRLIGNAVPVRIGEIVAESIFNHLNLMVKTPENNHLPKRPRPGHTSREKAR
jgi:DNA (cytosine-5)-methyltransferase 1